MLSIYASAGTIDQIKQIIRLEDRLDELVAVYNSLEKAPAAAADSLIVDTRGILQAIDWKNVAPPYLLPSPLPLEAATLLGLIFSKLGNGEKAWSYLQQQQGLIFDIGISSRLQHGYEIDLNEFSNLLPVTDPTLPFEKYRLRHNAAVVRHYGFIQEPIAFEEVRQYYQEAIELAPFDEYRAFTAKQFAVFLLDAGAAETAETLLLKTLQGDISEDAQFGLKAALTDAWMKQLTVPYDTELLRRLKQTLWEVLQYNERHDRQAETGLLLVDAAHIANISDSFSEALGYLNRAIGIFETEALEALAGQAQLRKGTLLYTWAQKGNPQFYKPAIESYQRALKVFRREVTPDVFADIHHNLAVLYSEMPTDSKKKGIWAGIASTSFQEALDYYTKADFPYEYGMICNNYGNALTKFPAAVHSDNFEKALYYYEEALRVRDANYPYERAITLLNYLAAGWQVSNETDEFNEERYFDMVRKAEEVKALVTEEAMLREAEKHLELLQELRQVAEK